MLWLVHAKTPVPAGYLERLVLNHPSSAQKDVWEAVRAHVKARQLLISGIKYGLIGPLRENDPQPIVLAEQINVCNLSGAAVASALAAPHGQPGQNRPESALDALGFQELGDHALPVRADDAMFGDVDDGTSTDILQDGGGMQERRRPHFGADLNGPAHT